MPQIAKKEHSKEKEMIWMIEVSPTFASGFLWGLHPFIFSVCASVSLFEGRTDGVNFGGPKYGSLHVTTWILLFLWCSLFSFLIDPSLPPWKNARLRDRTPAAITVWFDGISVATQVPNTVIKCPHAMISNVEQDKRRSKVEIASGSLCLAQTDESTMLWFRSRQLKKISVTICQLITKHHSNII